MKSDLKCLKVSQLTYLRAHTSHSCTIERNNRIRTTRTKMLAFQDLCKKIRTIFHRLRHKSTSQFPIFVKPISRWDRCSWKAGFINVIFYSSKSDSNVPYHIKAFSDLGTLQLNETKHRITMGLTPIWSWQYLENLFTKESKLKCNKFSQKAYQLTKCISSITSYNRAIKMFSIAVEKVTSITFAIRLTDLQLVHYFCNKLS